MNHTNNPHNQPSYVQGARGFPTPFPLIHLADYTVSNNSRQNLCEPIENRSEVVIVWNCKPFKIGSHEIDEGKVGGALESWTGPMAEENLQLWGLTAGRRNPDEGQTTQEELRRDQFECHSLTEALGKSIKHTFLKQWHSMICPQKSNVEGHTRYHEII